MPVFVPLPPRNETPGWVRKSPPFDDDEEFDDDESDELFAKQEEQEREKRAEKPKEKPAEKPKVPKNDEPKKPKERRPNIEIRPAPMPPPPLPQGPQFLASASTPSCEPVSEPSLSGQCWLAIHMNSFFHTNPSLVR